MSAPFKIEAIHAFICDNGEEGEGLIGQAIGGTFMPYVAADRARLESLKPRAQEIANMLGKPVKLIRLGVREDLEILEPAVRS